MKKLRAYYEQELGLLQEFNQEFAAKFPAQAGHLGMANGTVNDPHVERLIQATALSNARIAQLIDESDTKTTEALLGINYPHFLRPFPAASIVWIDTKSAQHTLTPGRAIASGSVLNAKHPDGHLYKFRSTYEVRLAPIEIAEVVFHPLLDLPENLRRDSSVSSSISITIRCLGNLDFQRLRMDEWRLFIDAEASLSAAIRDALFMHVKEAFLESDFGWTALPYIPIEPVGFDARDALLPQTAIAHPAYRLLTEYFAFPEKFHFFAIRWSHLNPWLPVGARQLTLHLGLSSIGTDSPLAKRLATISDNNFKAGCTPAINLFKRSACPIELSHTSTDYLLMPEAKPGYAYDIYSVDKVTMVPEPPQAPTFAEFYPYYSLRHGESSANQGRYYLVRRDPFRALSHPGHETRISLVDQKLNPLTFSNASVSIELTCTNRDLPSQLPCSGAEGDLEMELTAGSYPVRFLRRPTQQYRFSTDMHWRLISQLSLSQCQLQRCGLNGLKEVLTLYDLPQSAVSQRQIAGITGIEYRPATAWLRNHASRDPVQGVEIRLTIDEDAFAGSSVHLFIQVLDYFFGLHVQVNSFTQLNVMAHSNQKELLRCPPRHGAALLL